jgi:di/tricarboxylate transporter
MIPYPIQPYFAIFVVFVLFLAIYKEMLRPSVAFLFCVLVFIISGILTSKEVLAGLSNESIGSIILLILITAGLRKNFNIEFLFDIVFKKTRNYKVFLLKLMSQVAILSSFVNNTPVVALMTPYVFNWGKKNNISPSKLLIPLSFATILGGMITIIGTSTTLVLNGFLMDRNLEGLKLEDFIFTGFAVSVTGILFIILLGHKLLPDHKDILETFIRNKREYVVETKLTEDSKLIDKTILEAGLRNLKGVFLVEIIRKDKVVSPVGPNEIIQKDDILIFAGNTQDIVELVKSDLGINLPDAAHNHADVNEKLNIAEAVVSSNSNLAGVKVKDSNFRKRYDAAIVAIHRNGERLSGKIGNIRLSAGDLLLLYAGKDFREKTDLFRDIIVISNQENVKKPSKKKGGVFAVLVVCTIALLTLGYWSLFNSLLIIFTLMIAFKMISIPDMKREIDINLVAILVFSLAIGQAIIKTQAGSMIANVLLDFLEPHGKIAIMAGLMALTTLLTSFITNVGAISITFPLAFAISQTLNMNGAPFYLAIAFAASAAFLTPVSYQTNLIIYGPGGYNFKDFFKIGFPVTIIYLLTSLACILLLYKNILFA